MQIINLPSSELLSATDVLVKETNGGTTQKIAGQAFADSVRNLSGAASSGELTDAYSALQTYDVGDYCIYQDALYRCNTAISSEEEWNSEHWTATTVADELNSRVGYSDVVDSLSSSNTNPISSRGVYNYMSNKSGNSAGKVYYFRSGNVVFATCYNVSGFTVDGNNHITDNLGTAIIVPSGYRPAGSVRIIDEHSVKISIDSGGVFTTSDIASGSSTSLWFSTCWITSNTMPST